MIDELFNSLFQKEISINLGNKVLREGRLLLFCIKDFYLHFTLVYDGANKIFELPYPFKAYNEEQGKVLVLDYRLKSFTKGLPDISDNAKPLHSNQKHMKIFDNIIKIIERY